MAGQQNILVRIGANIGDLERSLKTAGDKVGKFADSIKGVGDSMTKNITTPLAGLGLGAVASFASAESAGSKLEAQLGVTGAEADKLKEMAKGIYTNGFGESLEQSSDGLVKVKQNMRDLPEDKLKKVTEGALAISSAFGGEMNEVTRSAGMLMEQFGVDGETALDMITKGYQTGLDKNGDFLDSVNEYGPQFEMMGMSAEDMFNTFANGAEGGAFSIDKVGDAVKEFNVRVGDGSKATADGMAGLTKSTQGVWAEFNKGKATGEEVFSAVIKDLSKMDNQVEANQIGVSLFGTQWEDLGGDVVTAMATGTKGMGSFEGATQKASDSLANNFGSRMQIVWRQLKEDIEPLGEAIANIAEVIIPPLGEAISKVANWFNGLSPAMQGNIVIIGGIVMAIGPLLMMLGSVIGMLPALITGFGAVGKAFTFFGKGLPMIVTGIKAVGTALKFLALNPIGIAIMAIAGLVAIGILVYKNWDSIKPKLIAVWEAVKTAVTVLWKGLVVLGKAVFNGLKTYFTTVFNAYKTVILAVWNGIKAFLSAIWNGLVSVGKAVFNGLKLYFTTVFNVYKTIILTVWKVIKSTVTTVWNAIKNTAVTIFNALKNTITTVFNAIKNTATTVWNAIKSTITNVWNGIKTGVQNAVNNVKSKITNTFNAIKSTTTTVWNGIKNAMTKPIETAKNTISGIIDKVKGFFSGLKLSFPKISMPKLPSFSLSGKFSLNPPSVPKLGVNWYKTGGVFDGASVIGVGEAGAEAVVPLNGNRMKPFAREIAGQMPQAEGGNGGFGGGDIVLHLDGREVARVTAPFMDKGLGSRIESKNRAGGIF